MESGATFLELNPFITFNLSVSNFDRIPSWPGVEWGTVTGGGSRPFFGLLPLSDPLFSVIDCEWDS